MENNSIFSQIGNVSYIIIYTIFTILFYTIIIPKNTLNKYSLYINSLMFILGIFSFYKGTTKNIYNYFNIRYEQIKILIIFTCFLSLIITFYSVNQSSYLGFPLLISIIIGVFIFLYLIVLLTIPSNTVISTINDSISLSNIPNIENSNVLKIFQYSLLILLGVIISGLLIIWITYNIETFSGSNSSIVKFILNLILVTLMLGFVYKIINVKLPAGNHKKNAFFTMLLNVILYIPCLFNKAFDWLGGISLGKPDAGSFIMLAFSILLFLIYFKMPSFINLIGTQGGKQLLNEPVYTDTLYNLGTVNTSEDQFDYQYAISCWIYIDSSGPNTNANYSNYTSLLNFGDKPNILYNGRTNTLMVTMQQKNLKDVTKNKLIDFDENGNRIVYKNNDLLLQKWNNIIINYNGGTLDIFLNGKLVNSTIGVVPYYTYENLTIGENNGIKGGICNVVYFSRFLNTQNIYFIYNSVKNKTPPTLNESNETIVKQNINQIGSSVNSF